MSSNGDMRGTRAERNEEAFQVHNERRADMEQAGGVDEDEPVPFVCECDRPDCVTAIEVPVGEYERAAAPRDQFLVAPGHEDPRVEEVVEVHEGWLVVSKPGLRRPGR
jgi:hypothetical protein